MNSLNLISEDQYRFVSSRIPNCSDYFDFPSSMIAFGESLKSSELWYYNEVFFRKSSNVLTIITYFCSGSKLTEILSDLRDKYKIKSLNFANKDFNEVKTIKYYNEFYVDEDFDWGFSKLTSKHRGNIKRDWRNGNKEFCVITDLPTIKTLMELFEEWVNGAKLRHFMVIKGHYLRYLQMAYDPNYNIVLLSFINKNSNQLYGVAGFEVFDGQAQITIMKHRFGRGYFPTYFWLETIRYIQTNFKVKKVYCGSTADELKRRLGMKSCQSYKILI